MLWGGNPTQILLRYGTYFFGTVASIHNAQEQMSEVRSFAYIIDTSMKKNGKQKYESGRKHK